MDPRDYRRRSKQSRFALSFGSRALGRSSPHLVLQSYTDLVMSSYPQAVERAALFDLSAHGKIELAGPEALMFLNNLCTQDVKGLPVGEGREAFLTTAKAKIVAHVLIGHFAAADDGAFVLLDTVAGQAGKVLAHLNHFLISEQVELADRTASLAQFHICGPRAQDVLHESLGEAVADLKELGNRTLAWSGGEPILVRRNDVLGLPGFDVFCPAAISQELAAKVTSAGAAPATDAVWDILRIEAGWPVYGIDMDDKRLAMEVGRTRAISYTKGCYLGQETIVMARDRGQVNRLLMGITIAGDTPFAAGAKAMRGNDEVGQVTSSVFSPRLGQVIALAYLKRGSWDAGTKVEVDGRPGIVSALPFC